MKSGCGEALSARTEPEGATVEVAALYQPLLSLGPLGGFIYHRRLADPLHWLAGDDHIADDHLSSTPTHLVHIPRAGAPVKGIWIFWMFVEAHLYCRLYASSRKDATLTNSTR